MRSKFLLAFLLLPLMACQDDFPAGQINESDDQTNPVIAAFSDSDVNQGIVRIKIEEGVQPLRIGATRSTGGSGHAKLDAIAAKLGASEIRHLFVLDSRYPKREKASGMDRWYELRFDKDIPVSSVIRQMSGIEEFEVVEPSPRLHRIEDNHFTGYLSAGDDTDFSMVPTATSDFNDPRLSDQWHYNNVGGTNRVAGCDMQVFNAWKTTTGDPSVIVAVVDGGVQYDHPDLAANMWTASNGTHGYNAVYGNTTIHPEDHGTHVAGTIAAVNNNGVGVCGIAGGNGSPNTGARIMSCQIFDGEDQGNADVAMKWAADNGAVICQNSWGYGSDVPYSYLVYLQAEVDAINYFINYAGTDDNGNQTGPMKGGIVMFSAGNDNVSRKVLLAGYSSEQPLCFSVASIGPTYKRAYYSNYGDWITITTTGGDQGSPYGNKGGVLSTVTNGSYDYYQGTSMACPHASGVAALVVSRYAQKKGFTNTKLRELLIAACDKDILDQYNTSYKGMFGAGLLSADKAVNTAPDVWGNPDPVTNLKVNTPDRYGTELQWVVPKDYAQEAVGDYTIFWDKSDFSSNFDYSTTTTEGKVFISQTTTVGATLKVVLDDIADAPKLEANTKYYFAVVATDQYYEHSAPVFVSGTTKANNVPEVKTQFSNVEITEVGLTYTVSDMRTHFSDKDGEREVLKYNVKSDNTSVVTISVSGYDIKLRAVKAGTATITVTATDRDNASVAATFKVTVYERTNPNPVTNLQLNTPDKYNTSLQWVVPQDYDKKAVGKYTIMWDKKDFSAGFNVNTTKTEGKAVITKNTTVGETLKVVIGDLEGSPVLKANTKYYFAVVGTDPFDLNSAPNFVSGTTAANNVPEVKTPFADVTFDKVGSEQIVSGIGAHFTDKDGVKDVLKYSVYSDNEGITTAEMDGNNNILLYSVKFGYANIIVTATDSDGGEVSTTFKTAARDVSEEIYLYPMPVESILNIRMGQGISGNGKIKIYNSANQKVVDTTMAVDTVTPKTLNLSNLSSGYYTFYITVGTKEIKRTIIKK